MALPRHVAESQIPAVEDTQQVVVRILAVVRAEPVQLLVDTAESVLDTVMEADIVEVSELDVVSGQEQDTEWVLHRDTEQTVP